MRSVQLVKQLSINLHSLLHLYGETQLCVNGPQKNLDNTDALLILLIKGKIRPIEEDKLKIYAPT